MNASEKATDFNTKEGMEDTDCLEAKLKDVLYPLYSDLRVCAGGFRSGRKLKQ